MRGLAILIVAGVALASSMATARAGVTVTYDHPEKFTDAYLRGGYGTKALAPALDGIREYLELLGRRHLKPDQTLTVEVLDLDLAGQFEPWRAYGYDIRYMRDVTWPKMKVRYTLVQNSATQAQGEETIGDMNYLMDASARVSSDSLRYEKTMLNDWFRNRFERALP